MDNKAFGSTGLGTLLLVAALFSAIPSAQANYAGRVHKENSRVVRPLAEDQQTPVPELTAGAVSNAPIKAGMSDDSFVLKTDAASGSMPSGLEAWNPWAGTVSKPAPIPTFVATRVTQAPAAQLPANVDYGALEQAYAEAIPRPVARAVSPPHGIPVSLIQANALRASRAMVDYDNCACGTAMPSDNCVRSRMEGFGVRPSAATAPTNGARAVATASNVRPGNSGPAAVSAASAGAIPSLSVRGSVPVAPVVLPSGIAIPAGAGFTNQIR